MPKKIQVKTDLPMWRETETTTSEQLQKICNFLQKKIMKMNININISLCISGGDVSVEIVWFYKESENVSISLYSFFSIEKNNAIVENIILAIKRNDYLSLRK